MRICIFSTSIDKRDGGPSRSVPLLAKGLAELDLSVTLLTCRSDEMNTHILENSNVRLEFISKNISYKDLENFLKSRNFDLIHCQNLWNPLYHKFAKIAQKRNIPYLMTPRGCLEPWSLKQKRLKKKLALLLYQKKDLQKASCILATSEMEARNLRALRIKTPIAVIPNGIDVSDYVCRTDKSIIKNQICFISRIHPKKGLEFLIEAWEKIHANFPNWKIVIAGNGADEYIHTLNQSISNKNLSDTIAIIPPVFGEKKYNLYSQSAIFILPTFSENFGMVIAEAMSCGIPVITTSGTPWSQLNDLGLGWCVDLSVDNIAQALSSAMNNGIDSLYEIGMRCSQYIADNYQYTSVSDRLLKVYEWILDRSNQPEYVYI